mgnify:CR=1 FL=1
MIEKKTFQHWNEKKELGLNEVMVNCGGGDGGVG